MIVAMHSFRAALLAISPEMLALIGEIDEFKGAWRAFGTLAPERLHQLRRVATIESVGSSTRIEGAKLSDREVEALLGRVEAQSLATRDEQEVAGYSAAMELIFASHAAIPITEGTILQLHSTLLKFSEKDDRHRGRYKILPNRIEAFDGAGRSIGVVLETSPPLTTAREMEDLVAWYRRATETREVHPLVAVGMFVAVFLAIHPFQDGNGRLSRALTTLLLLRAGYGYVPYSSLESVIERSKEDYYLALRRTQSTLAGGSPDWAPWLTYFLRAMQAQKRGLEAKIEYERLMRGTLPALAVQILELAAGHGSVSVREVVGATGVPRATAKAWLGRLVAQGALRTLGRGRGTRYARS